MHDWKLFRWCQREGSFCRVNYHKVTAIERNMDLMLFKKSFKAHQGWVLKEDGEPVVRPPESGARNDGAFPPVDCLIQWREAQASVSRWQSLPARICFLLSVGDFLISDFRDLGRNYNRLDITASCHKWLFLTRYSESVVLYHVLDEGGRLVEV